MMTNTHRAATSHTVYSFTQVETQLEEDLQGVPLPGDTCNATAHEATTNEHAGLRP
jgi:hypothetical protein